MQVGQLCTIWSIKIFQGVFERTAKLEMVQTSCTWDKNLCRFLFLLCIACPLSSFKPSFHSLFKVLFIFPSRYFFAIGLLHIFSLRWSLPPTFRLQSQTALLPDQTLSKKNYYRNVKQGLKTPLSLPSPLPTLPSCEGKARSKRKEIRK